MFLSKVEDMTRFKISTEADLMLKQEGTNLAILLRQLIRDADFRANVIRQLPVEQPQVVDGIYLSRWNYMIESAMLHGKGPVEFRKPMPMVIDFSSRPVYQQHIFASLTPIHQKVLVLKFMLKDEFEGVRIQNSFAVARKMEIEVYAVNQLTKQALGMIRRIIAADIVYGEDSNWKTADISLNALELNVSEIRVLNDIDIKYVRDLLKLTVDEVRHVRGIGKSRLKKIQSNLAERDLSLKQS